jgi:hypothetical protein
MLFKCQYNKLLIQISKRNLSQKFRTWDGKSLLDHILKFDGKNLKRKSDFLEVPQNKFHNTGESFIIYNKKSKFPVMFILSFVMIGVSIYLFYYLAKNVKNRPKTHILLLAINTFIFIKYIKSNIWRLGRYIKTLELTRDLSKLTVRTFNSKIYTLRPEDINMIKNNYFYMFQYDFFREHSLIVNIKGKDYYIPLKNTNIPDKDILSLVVRGYKLKF